MKKIILIAVAIVALGIGGVIVANSGGDDMSMGHENKTQGTSNSDAEVKPGPNEVIIKNFAFNPEKLTIKKGTKVTWTNQDSARHDITPDQPSENFKASELLAKGESYSFTFNAVGNYSYKCSPHPYMKAMIEVTE